jgi:hypothetical protein
MKVVNIMLEEKQVEFFRKNHLKIGEIIREALDERMKTLEIEK